MTFGLFINKLKFIDVFSDGMIILSSNLNTFFKLSNLPFPLALFINEINGLLNLSASIVGIIYQNKDLKEYRDSSPLNFI